MRSFNAIVIHKNQNITAPRQGYVVLAYVIDNLYTKSVTRLNWLR